MESSQVNKENEKDSSRAKEIFWLCGGNRFHMWQEELLEEFESYETSEITRIRWALEMRDEYLSKLQEEKEESKEINLLYGLCLLAIDYRDEIGFLAMVKYIRENIDRFDSYDKIKLAEIILKALKSIDKYHKEQETYGYAIQVLKDVCEQPITYADYRYYNGKIPTGLNEQAIKERARQGIEEGKEFWYSSPEKKMVKNLTSGIKKFLSILKRKH